MRDVHQVAARGGDLEYLQQQRAGRLGVADHEPAGGGGTHREAPCPVGADPLSHRCRLPSLPLGERVVRRAKSGVRQSG